MKRRDEPGRIIIAWYLLLLLTLKYTLPCLAGEVVFGLQINDDVGDSYGSSMVYDAKTHRLYVTGTTYSEYFKMGSKRIDDASSISKPDCFFGVLQLPNQVFMSPQWLRRVQIGMEDVSEACSALHISSNNGEAYLLGHSTKSMSVMSSLAQDQERQNHKDPSAAGLVLHLTRGANLMGGLLMGDNAVQYPVAIQATEDSNHLFIASIKSDDIRINPSFERLRRRSDATQWDLSTAGYLPPEYGSNFTILLQSFKRERHQEASIDYGRRSTIHTTLEPSWSREFGLHMPTSLQVSSLLYISSKILVMAGSTHHASQQITDHGDMKQTDWDGFLMMVDPITGDQLGSHRIRSLPQGGDDRVLGLCRSQGDSTDIIYAVGITEGTIHYKGRPQEETILSYQPGSYRAFILKLNARTLETLWVSYVEAKYEDRVWPSQIHGISCAVTPDGSDVYMGGTVMDGAVLHVENPSSSSVDARSYGGDDIFVAQYETADGKLNYAKQLGTTYDDSLGQGESLTTNLNGDVIVLGNTNGSLMRSKATPETTDMFVMSFARKRGHHLPLFELMMDRRSEAARNGYTKSTNPYRYTYPYKFDKEEDKKVNVGSDSSNADGEVAADVEPAEPKSYSYPYSGEQSRANASPTQTPVTQMQSKQPSWAPSDSPSAPPSGVPSAKPSSIPSGVPSLSGRPSNQPSAEPSNVQSLALSDVPSGQPSAEHSNVPSISLSDVPSGLPSAAPSNTPSIASSNVPSRYPSAEPSRTPSIALSAGPSGYPSAAPSKAPSTGLSDSPSRIPSAAPSMATSNIPSHTPSWAPSEMQIAAQLLSTQQLTEATSETNHLFATNTKESLSAIASHSSAPSALVVDAITSSPTTGSPTTSTPTTALSTTATTTVATGALSAGATKASHTTLAPTTEGPTTVTPSTAVPVTANPTTAIPTTDSPSTVARTTASPATGSPTTSNPTTASPTTGSPTTSNPSIASPTTGSPATSSPTTASPTTGSSATSSPNTAPPTTASPFIMPQADKQIKAQMDEKAWNQEAELMPYIASLVVMGTIIVFFCILLLYMCFWRQKKRRLRVVPGLGEEYPEPPSFVEKSVANDSTSDTSISLRPSQQKKENENEDIVEVVECESDLTSKSMLRAGSQVTRHEAFLPEMQPSQTPPHPLDAFGRGLDFCGVKLWDNEPSPKRPSLLDISENGFERTEEEETVCVISEIGSDKYCMMRRKACESGYLEKPMV